MVRPIDSPLSAIMDTRLWSQSTHGLKLQYEKPPYLRLIHASCSSAASKRSTKTAPLSTNTKRWFDSRLRNEGSSRMCTRRVAVKEAKRRRPKFIDVGKRALKIIDPWPGGILSFGFTHIPIDNTASPTRRSFYDPNNIHRCGGSEA